MSSSSLTTGAPRARTGRPGRAARFFDLRRTSLYRVVGNLGWPILQKELRADLRKNRFFMSHLICLAALAAGILWMVASPDKSDPRPEDVGRAIFNTFFWIQYLVVLVVFPAFSSNAVSEERSGNTFDLLITTDLRAAEVVWGKFMATSVYCLIYVIATVPLLSVSLLFAGVTLLEIGEAYLFLLSLTVLVCMTGVFISSCFTSSIRATITMYVLVFAAIACSWLLLKDAYLDKGSTAVRSAWRSLFGTAGDPLSEVLTLTGLVGLFGVVFAYLFLFTENRLLPAASDRTSKLRVLTFGVFLAALAFRAAGGFPTGASAREDDFTEILFWSSLGLLAAALFFTAETADVPQRLRMRSSRLKGPLFPLRVFAPGALWGLVYVMALCAMVTGILAAVWFGALSQGEPADARYREALFTAPLYLFALASLGFYLSTLDFSPLYTRLTVSFIFIITLLLPVIFKIGGHGDGILSLYYLSPLTIWDSLAPPTHPPEGPGFQVLGAPVVCVAQGLFPTLGVLFTSLGVWQSRKKGYPLL